MIHTSYLWGFFLHFFLFVFNVEHNGDFENKELIEKHM